MEPDRRDRADDGPSLLHRPGLVRWRPAQHAPRVPCTGGRARPGGDGARRMRTVLHRLAQRRRSGEIRRIKSTGELAIGADATGEIIDAPRVVGGTTMPRLPCARSSASRDHPRPEPSERQYRPCAAGAERDQPATEHSGMRTVLHRLEQLRRPGSSAESSNGELGRRRVGTASSNFAPWKFHRIK